LFAVCSGAGVAAGYGDRQHELGEYKEELPLREKILSQRSNDFRSW